MPLTWSGRPGGRWSCSTATCVSESRRKAAVRQTPRRPCSACSTSCSKPVGRWSATTSSAPSCARRASTLSARRAAARPVLPALRSRELSWTPDLVELVSKARDAGHEVLLFERPMPDAVSVAGLGRCFDIVATAGGVGLEDQDHELVDHEPGADRVAAAARLWRRLSQGLDKSAGPGPSATGAIALGGFAFRPDRDPGQPWSGFPALLLRIPELAVTRVRGRTFVTAAGAD